MLLGDEHVDRIFTPCSTRFGHGWPHRSPESPVLPGIGLRLFVGGCRGTRRDPIAQELHFCGLEWLAFMFRGHPFVTVLRRHLFYQQTAGSVSRENSGSTFASLDKGISRIQAQQPFLLQCPMAGITPRLEQWFDLPQIVRCRRGPRIPRH